MNSFGHILQLTTFGESHGAAIGGILDGVPSGFEIDLNKVQQALDRRKPGAEAIGSRRKESDRVQLLSGVFEGKTLGTPIGFIIPNEDAKSGDYAQLRDAYRPNHADFTYETKYGIRDYRGGGRASARETACRVAAGSIAAQILNRFGIKTIAYTSAIGRVEYECQNPNTDMIYSSEVRCPDSAFSAKMKKEIETAGMQGDTIGGCVSCKITGVPAGLGEPIGGKLQSMLASALMSIPAAKGFEYGLGMAASTARGSESADIFLPGEKITTATNNSGGIQGGISNGSEISLRVAFKPAPTLLRPIETVTREGERITLTMKGRHDPCVVPRAVPVVEAMANLVLLDALMLHRASTLRNCL